MFKTITIENKELILKFKSQDKEKKEMNAQGIYDGEHYEELEDMLLDCELEIVRRAFKDHPEVIEMYGSSIEVQKIVYTSITMLDNR